MRRDARFPLPLLLFLLLSTAPSCRSREWKQTLVTARSPIAIYVERQEREGKLVPQNFAHPPHISALELKSVLQSLKYHPTGPLGLSRQSTTEPVFAEGETEALARPLSTEFQKVGPDERIRFLVARTSWKPLFLGAKGISAVVFFTSPDRMNLAFDLIDESLPDESGNPRAMSFPDDPLSITGSEPVIVPPPGAALQEPGEKGRLHPLWVVLDPAKIPLAREAAPPPAGKRATAEASESSPQAAATEAEAVKRRLKVLEDLKRDGTISAEEYEKARQEILLQRER